MRLLLSLLIAIIFCCESIDDTILDNMFLDIGDYYIPTFHGRWIAACKVGLDAEVCTKALTYGFVTSTPLLSSRLVAERAKIEADISAGFFVIYSTSPTFRRTVSGSTAKGISSEMYYSMEEKRTSSFEIACDKGTLWQWVMDSSASRKGIEHIGKEAEDFALYTSQTLCTSAEVTPKCVPGHCDINGKQILSTGGAFVWYNHEKKDLMINNNGFENSDVPIDIDDYHPYGSIFRFLEIEEEDTVAIYMQSCKKNVAFCGYPDHMLSTEWKVGNYNNIGLLGFCRKTANSYFNKPLYQLRNRETANHFVTFDKDEVKKGYEVEDVFGCYVQDVGP